MQNNVKLLKNNGKQLQYSQNTAIFFLRIIVIFKNANKNNNVNMIKIILKKKR